MGGFIEHVTWGYYSLGNTSQVFVWTTCVVCGDFSVQTLTGCRCMVSVIECVLVTNRRFSFHSFLPVFHQDLVFFPGLDGCLCTALLGSPDIASCLWKGHKWPHRITWTTVGKKESVGLLWQCSSDHLCAKGIHTANSSSQFLLLMWVCDQKTSARVNLFLAV